MSQGRQPCRDTTLSRRAGQAAAARGARAIEARHGGVGRAAGRAAGLWVVHSVHSACF